MPKPIPCITHIMTKCKSAALPVCKVYTKVIKRRTLDGACHLGAAARGARGWYGVSAWRSKLI